MLFLFHASFSQKDSLAIKYAKTITADELSKHLHVLASDEYEGRETGRKGQKMAAEYIKKHFENIGIPPVNGSYYQEFPLTIKYPHGVTININDKEYEFLKDFYFFRGFNDTLIKANEIVFLGYGIDDENYSDYKDAGDLNGKIVMFFDGEPFDKKKKSYVTQREGFSGWTMSWRKKLERAKRAKVAGALIITNDMKGSIENLRHYIEAPSMKLDTEEKKPHRRPPNFYISTEMADALLSQSKKSTEVLKKKIEKKGKPISFTTQGNLKIDVSRKEEKVVSENVLGYIEGTDKKDEVLILTAHYDHIGIDGEEVYNGADDDGSGTVALLELAEAFSVAKKAGNGPRRSILIMPVAGEEKGLLGSKYYTDNPIFKLENTIADLNIDMIGRIDTMHEGNANYVYLIGSDKLSTELHAISEKANATYTNIELDYTFNQPDDPNRFYYRSDHYNFAKNQIPVIFYFNGVHEDYHKSTDTVEKIDFDKIEKITKLVFYTAWELANREKRIEVDVENEFEKEE
ncbi:MAG: peptidase M28 [Flavobacteriales bacterium]|nr:MAG: peptidase M28 [Flavobacteriales bacterium]